MSGGGAEGCGALENWLSNTSWVGTSDPEYVGRSTAPEGQPNNGLETHWQLITGLLLRAVTPKHGLIVDQAWLTGRSKWLNFNRVLFLKPCHKNRFWEARLNKMLEVILTLSNPHTKKRFLKYFDTLEYMFWLPRFWNPCNKILKSWQDLMWAWSQIESWGVFGSEIAEILVRSR